MAYDQAIKVDVVRRSRKFHAWLTRLLAGNLRLFRDFKFSRRAALGPKLFAIGRRNQSVRRRPE